MGDVRARLAFPLRGLDSDDGGEFINHQLVRYCRAQTPPIHFTRSRPYQKNDQAHIEQKNFTNVRLWFGYERYDLNGELGALLPRSGQAVRSIQPCLHQGDCSEHAGLVTTPRAVEATADAPRRTRPRIQI